MEKGQRTWAKELCHGAGEGGVIAGKFASQQWDAMVCVRPPTLSVRNQPDKVTMTGQKVAG